KLEKAKFLEVIKVLDLKQVVVIVDITDNKEFERKVNDLIFSMDLERFNSDDEVERLVVKDNKLYIYLDILKKRAIENNSNRYR
ncbi:MAG TPA: hypothetical protein VJZ51_03120, partial [Bacilli bacterium]|nr:hypothetical protein [Bacilli bacterium]